jgi:PPK2 family polyphosphate:nucleotide phosphotransferase
MHTSVPSPFLVPFDGSFDLRRVSTSPPSDADDGKVLKKRLEDLNQELADLQQVLYADDRFSLLLVFQAMDAAGKDSTIRKVLSGVNPAGCQVYSFKQPSKEELDHDFLWRTASRLPERGRIGVFNRSYYEEVLVVRVHPELLGYQRLPQAESDEAFWAERLAGIAAHERHLAHSGTVIVKFFLHVGRDEQKARFLSRIEEPKKNWKFSAADCRERAFWAEYMLAYEAAMRATSKPWAPWYAVPADDKTFMRTTVADVVVRTLRALPLRYPGVEEETRARFEEVRALLLSEP